MRKFCIKCGSEMRLEAKFCPKCGYRVAQSENEDNIVLNEKTRMRKKKVNIGVLAFILLVVLSFCALMVYNLRIDKEAKGNKSQLIGSWYIDGDDSPYFKLKDGGKAKFAFSLTTDPNGQRHAGLCDVSCKWKIQRGHLILVSITNIDLGEIVSIEDDVLTCDDNGTIVKYRRKGLSIYDVW